MDRTELIFRWSLNLASQRIACGMDGSASTRHASGFSTWHALDRCSRLSDPPLCAACSIANKRGRPPVEHDTPNAFFAYGRHDLSMFRLGNLSTGQVAWNSHCCLRLLDRHIHYCRLSSANQAPFSYLPADADVGAEGPRPRRPRTGFFSPLAMGDCGGRFAECRRKHLKTLRHSQ